MKVFRLSGLLIIMLLLANCASAQNDDPWWKKLFKKETVEEMENGKGDDNDVMIIPDPESKRDSVDTVVIPENRPRGVISVYTPAMLDSLNNQRKNDPQPMSG